MVFQLFFLTVNETLAFRELWKEELLQFFHYPSKYMKALSYKGFYIFRFFLVRKNYYLFWLGDSSFFSPLIYNL